MLKLTFNVNMKFSHFVILVNFCLLIYFGIVGCSISHDVVREVENNLSRSLHVPFQYLHNITENFNISESDIFLKNISKLTDVVLSNRSKCVKDLWYILKNLKSEWSIQMLDSFGKPPSGIILGNLLWIGKYSECSSIFVNDANDPTVRFHGMYCLAQYNISMPDKIHMPMKEIPVKLGVCLPDSCHSINIKGDLKHIFDVLYSMPLIKKYSDDVKITTLKCKPRHSNLDYPSKILVIFLCFYLFLTLTGTLITVIKYFFEKPTCFTKPNELKSVINYQSDASDCRLNEENPVYFETENSEIDQIHFFPQRKAPNGYLKCLNVLEKVVKPLRCFSVIENADQILNTSSSRKQFPCLHGIKFFSMTWVILGHTYVHNINYIDNYLTLLKDIDNLAFQAVLQGTFSVDTFFLVGGFLLGYLYLREADKRNGKINLFGLFLHRFLRLTPVYAFLIGFTSLIFKHIGSGPFWEEADDVVTCKQYWWWNLLYINNFLPINFMCLTWTWYLSNDMQFFIVSSLLLYVLWRWKYLGIGIFCTLLVSSWMLTGYLSYLYDIPPLFMGITDVRNYTEYQGKLILAWNVLYSKPYCRIGPHIIGILLAYIMYCAIDKKVTLNMGIKVAGWILATFCSFSVIYGVYLVKLGPASLHFYNALGRSSFSVGVAWLIFSCLTEPSSVINKFLSYKLWIPLSRLTYCAYLFHPIVMNWYFQQLEVPLFFSHTTMVVLFISFLFISYAVAFIISILFEAPIINLEKQIYRR